MKTINLTLLEQMQLSDHEIEMRKRLFDFSSADVENLRSCQTIITDNIDRIVDAFYAQQMAMPEIALVVGDRDTLLRLRQSMRLYIFELFEGYYDAEYVNKRLRVGKVHERIGVTPKLYLSAIRLLHATLEDTIERAAASLRDHRDVESIRKSLLKLLLFDTQLVFDTYIHSLMSEIRLAKREVEIYAASLEEKIAERTNELRELSLRDSLTGLLNQRAFYEVLRREMAVSDRGSRPFSLVYFDLNNFKALNDSRGHRAGDAVLMAVGEALRSTMREVDHCCRYGGDEFCIIMPETRAEDAALSCHRLIGTFDRRRAEEITFSFGIRERQPGDGMSCNDLIRAADSLMYRAKERSRTEPGHHIVLADAENGMSPPV